MTTSASVDCGAVLFEFLTSSNSAIDTSVFQDNRAVDGAYKFKIGPISTASKAKAYNLKLKIYYSNAPGNAQFQPFIVNVVDPCKPHVVGYPQPTITFLGSLVDKTYTITQAADTQDVSSLYSTSPAHCAGRLVFAHNPSMDSVPSVVGSQGSAVSFVTDTFTYYYKGSNDLAGSTTDGITYTLTLYIAIDEVNVGVTTVDTHTLTIKNPCFDQTYFTVSDMALPDFTYTLYDVAPNDQWIHSPFSFTAS